MPWPTTNAGERLLASKLDFGRKIWKGVEQDNLQLAGFDGTAHALKIWNPHTNGLALLIAKSDGSTVLIDARDSGVTLGGPVTVTGGLLVAGGPEYNVRAYGADNTGSVASDAAIAAAIAAMPATGGVLYFPSGTYIVNNPAALTKGGIVRGDGRTSTNIFSSSATGNVFSVSLPTQTLISFRDMLIGKTAGAQPSTAGAGIQFSCSTVGQSIVAPTVENCYILNQWKGIELRDATGARIVNNQFGENRDCAIEFDVPGITPHGFGDHWVVGNTLSNGFVGNSRGIRIKRGAGFFVVNNKVLGFQVQIHLDLQAGALNQSDLWVLGNSLEGVTGTIANVSLAGASSFEDVIIANNQTALDAGASITLDSALINDVFVVGNTIDTLGGAGMYAIGGTAGADLYAAENKIQLAAGSVGFVNTGITNFRRGPNRVSGAGTLQSGAFAHIQPKSHSQTVVLPATNAALGALFQGPASGALVFTEPFMAIPHSVHFEGVEIGAIKAALASISATQMTALPVGAANATVYSYRATILGDG